MTCDRFRLLHKHQHSHGAHGTGGAGKDYWSEAYEGQGKQDACQVILDWLGSWIQWNVLLKMQTPTQSIHLDIIWAAPKMSTIH